MYEECRNMVQMNVFAGQKERHRHREWVRGYNGGKRRWDEWGD